MAQDAGMDIFIICTEVAAVKLHFGKPDEQELRTLTVEQAEKYLSEGHFGVGSMAPKIQAAIDFVLHGGEKAIITSLDSLPDALEGNTGTTITR